MSRAASCNMNGSFVLDRRGVDLVIGNCPMYLRRTGKYVLP